MTTDEGWDEKPPVEWLDYLPLVMLALAIAGLLTWGFLSSRRPDVLSSIVGCYVGSGQLDGEEVVIESAGRFRTSLSVTPIEITEDKLGLSISRKLSRDAALIKFKNMTVDPYVLFRISNDRRSFVVPHDETETTFSATLCGGIPAVATT